MTFSSYDLVTHDMIDMELKNLCKLIIRNNDKQSIYEQIKEQVKMAILRDELVEGDVLPSLRRLSQELHISILTTQRAYTELENESYVKNIQGKGCYVLKKSNELVRENLYAEIEESFQMAIEAAMKADYSIEFMHKILDQLWGLRNV